MSVTCPFMSVLAPKGPITRYCHMPSLVVQGLHRRWHAPGCDALQWLMGSSDLGCISIFFSACVSLLSTWTVRHVDKATKIRTSPRSSSRVRTYILSSLEGISPKSTCDILRQDILRHGSWVYQCISYLPKS